MPEVEVTVGKDYSWQLRRSDTSDSATVAWIDKYFELWRPSTAAADLLKIAGSAYCADRIILRSDAVDSWTRSIDMRVSLDTSEPAIATCAEAALSFLSGDRWKIGVTAETGANPFSSLAPLPDSLLPWLEADAVCLFSGGLDSLCGAIDLLERDDVGVLALVSHYESGLAPNRQTELINELKAHYGAHRIVSRRLWLRPETSTAADGEPSTRSRSILFISAAVALASSLGDAVPVVVPENGFIGLNVPLTSARVGSLSTRTTHPHFFELYRRLLDALGLNVRIENPYAFQTKGEMMLGSANSDLLARLAPRTLSCSHPEAARWVQREEGNCGYCFPCLIRRASLAAAGWDTDSYAWNALDDDSLLTDQTSERGNDLRAVVNAVLRPKRDIELLRNAPLPGERQRYLSVWQRGQDELAAWLRAGATGELAKVLTP